MGQNRKKLPCPKSRIFVYPAVIDFGQNLTLQLWRQITLGNFKGPYWGQWGPTGAKNWVKTLKITMPQNWIFRPKFDHIFMVPNHGGDHLRSILGPMGSHWSKKMGLNRKIYQAPKFVLSSIPRSSISAKIGPYCYGAKSWWGPPRVHLGANGVPLELKKMGQNRKKLPCPKIRIFDYPAVIDFGKNWTLRFWSQITVGTP